MSIFFFFAAAADVHACSSRKVFNLVVDNPTTCEEKDRDPRWIRGKTLVWSGDVYYLR
jgi:hypothetical protein